MFLIKSTFWLGLAFVIIQPTKIDFHSSSNALSKKAITTTSQILTSQVKSITCETLQCSGAKSLLLTSTILRTPNHTLPMQEIQSQIIAPIPQPRLKRAG